MKNILAFPARRVAERRREGAAMDALRKGNNEIEIAVTNLWGNRLIGPAKIETSKSEQY